MKVNLGNFIIILFLIMISLIVFSIAQLIHADINSKIQCKQLGYDEFTKQDKKYYCVGGEFALQMVRKCNDWGFDCKLYEVRESKIIGI